LFYPLFLLCISTASARLVSACFAKRSELIQAVSGGHENHLDKDPADCGYEHISRLENCLDHVSTAVVTLADDSQRYHKRPLARRSYFANLQVASFIPGTQRMASCRPPHGYRSASGRCSKIALIPVDGFTLSGQTYLAVMDRSCSCLYSIIKPYSLSTSSFSL